MRLTQEELAQRWNRSGNYIYLLESGKKPIPKKLEHKIVELEKEAEVRDAQVRDSDRLKEEAPGFRMADKGKIRRAPVVSWASAGIGGSYSDLAEQIEEAVETDCPDANCYALIVEGKSMEPVLRAGDRIVVAPNLEASNGDVVVARLAETGQVFLKVLQYLRTGEVSLTSYNSDFREIKLPKESFRFIQPVYALVNRRMKR